MKFVSLLGLIYWLSASLSVQSQSTRLDQRQQFNASDFLFDLAGGVSSDIWTGSSSNIRAVTVKEMPALKGEGVALTWFRIKPCGINLPHVHPRGSEILFVISGKYFNERIVNEAYDMTRGRVSNAVKLSSF